MLGKPFHFSRRRFLKTTGVLAGASALPAWYLDELRGYAATPKPLSPNERPNIALIGCGGQGRHDTTLAAKFGNVAAVCDVDGKHAEDASKQFGGAKSYKDFREVLQRDDIHVIVNGTPDHWHTIINLAALKAGKDVYSEKPLTLTIDEGKRLVKVARETGRVLQTGSQQRSDPRFRLACELVRNGRIGRITHVETILPAGRRGGPFGPAPVPPELNWDYWQGQAPAVPYVKERCHGSFRYWLEYSGGTMTDWGAHHNDIALWGLGLERSGPVAVEGKALVKMIAGGFTAPSEYQVEYTYANGVRHTCLSTNADNPSGGGVGQGRHHGVKFVGADGWIFVTRGKIEASQPDLLTQPLANRKEQLYLSNDHMGNFFACVRSRAQPICDAEIGHRSVTVCHLGVIAIRIGRKLNWDPDKEIFVNDKEANEFVAREQRKPWTYDMA